MSRHGLTPFNPAHEVTVGWDSPLQTFFVQVLDTAADEGDDYEVLWIGTSFGEVLDATAIVVAVRPFATVPDGLAHMLTADSRAKPCWTSPP